MMRKWMIVLLGIAIFIIAVIAGFLINSFVNFSKQENITEKQAVLAENENNEIINTSYSDILVSPNAEVIINQKYEKCGHTSKNLEIAPREIINLNEEKVKEFYENDGWEVLNFSSEEIIISRSNNGICSEHYILRESDGYISISVKNDIGEYIFKGLTDISVQYLAQEDLERLQEGIEVVGKENLNKYLEDFE